MTDLPDYKPQPDGRVVAGPEMPDWSKEKTRSLAGLAIALSCISLALIAGFFSGRVTAPDHQPKPVPFADRAVGQRVQVAAVCGGDLRSYQNAVLPLSKPLKPGDATLIKQQLENMGFQSVTVKGVTYGGNYYYFAQGCL